MIGIVYNPQARNGRNAKLFSEICTLLTDHHVEYNSYATQKAKDSNGIRSFCLKKNRIVIIGGDGSLNDVINSVVELNIPIVLIPAGSGNDFASHIYCKEPYHQKRALQLICSNRQRNVDVFKCNDLYFLVGFGLGFDGSVVEVVTNRKAKIPPLIKYWLAIFHQIFRYESIDISVKSNPNLSGRYLMCSAANAKTIGGGIKLAPTAVIDDGKLEFNLIDPVPWWKRLLYLPLIQNGKHTNLSIYHSQRVNDIVIETSIKAAAHCDGELIYDDSFHLKFVKQYPFVVLS
jgi:YegS/Rv2252/BmrU family lipid kinase